MCNQSVLNRGVGFTLIELMIVVAIVATLAAVAAPSYNRYVLKTHRADAKDMLIEMMRAQERYQARKRTYVSDLGDLGYVGSGDPEVFLSREGYYQLTASECTQDAGVADCVMLTATPVVGEGQEADGNVTLDSRGIKSSNWDY